MTNPTIDPKVIEAEENLLIDFHFLLQELMSEKGISRADLAEKTGLSKPRLTQILGSEANPTVKTMARLFHALDERICLSRKALCAEGEAPASNGDKPAEWQWEREASSVERKSEKELTSGVKKTLKALARTVKESWASNDNRASHERVMFIASEIALAPEAEAA